MPQVGFELTISAGERPQTYALHRAATGIGKSPMNRSLKVASYMKGKAVPVHDREVRI